MVTLPEGYRVIGIYGRYGVFLNALGFVMGKTVIPGSQGLEKDTRPDTIMVELK